jgi:hypothetical protein
VRSCRAIVRGIPSGFPSEKSKKVSILFALRESGMGGDTPALSRRFSQALIVSQIPKVTSVSPLLGLFFSFREPLSLI